MRAALILVCTQVHIGIQHSLGRTQRKVAFSFGSPSSSTPCDDLASWDIAILLQLSSRLVIPVFRNLLFGQKNVPARIPEDSFFLCFPEEFFTGTWFWRGCWNSCFFLHHRNFSQEFLWDRKSCIYPGILRIPEDSCSRQKLLALASD